MAKSPLPKQVSHQASALSVPCAHGQVTTLALDGARLAAAAMIAVLGKGEDRTFMCSWFMSSRERIEDLSGDWALARQKSSVNSGGKVIASGDTYTARRKYIGEDRYALDCRLFKGVS